jgi:hypothetical protein
MTASVIPMYGKGNFVPMLNEDVWGSGGIHFRPRMHNCEKGRRRRMGNKERIGRDKEENKGGVEEK